MESEVELIAACTHDVSRLSHLVVQLERSNPSKRYTKRQALRLGPPMLSLINGLIRHEGLVGDLLLPTNLLLLLRRFELLAKHLRLELFGFERCLVNFMLRMQASSQDVTLQLAEWIAGNIRRLLRVPAGSCKYLPGELFEKRNELSTEAARVVATYYLCLLNSLLHFESYDLATQVVGNRSGPCVLILQPEYYKMLLQTMNGARHCIAPCYGLLPCREVLKTGLALPEDERVLYFPNVINWVEKDDSYPDCLDYFCFYSSKSSQPDAAVRGLIEKVRQKTKRFLALELASLLSLEMECFVKNVSIVNAAEASEGLFRDASPAELNDKMERKLAKCLRLIEKCAESVRHRVHLLASFCATFSVKLKCLMRVFPGCRWLQKFACFHLLSEEELSNPAECPVPIEVRLFGLLNYPNALNEDDFATTPSGSTVKLIRQIWKYKRFGMPLQEADVEPEGLFSDLDFHCLRAMTVISLLKGDFGLAMKLYRNSKRLLDDPDLDSILNVDYVFCFLLFEMGYEEPSRSRLCARNQSMAKALFSLISNSFGSRIESSKGHDHLAGNPLVLCLFHFSGGFALLIDRKLFAACEELKRSLRILDRVLETQNGMYFENLLLLSYLSLLILYHLSQACLNLGNYKETKVYVKKGTDLATRYHSEYFLELFEAKQMVLDYFFSKEADGARSKCTAKHLRSFFDHCVVFGPAKEIEFSDRISEHCKQKCHLSIRTCGLACDRLYSDDLVRAMVLNGKGSDLDLFVEALEIGSTKSVDEALEQVLLSPQVTEYQRAVAIEISKSVLFRREEPGPTLAREWLGGSFQDHFLCNLSANSRLVTFKVHSTFLYINVWMGRSLVFHLKASVPSVGDLRARWSEIMRENEDSLLAPADSSDQALIRWWQKRIAVDGRLERFFSSLECDFLGPFRHLFTCNLVPDACLLANLSKVVDSGVSESQLRLLCVLGVCVSEASDALRLMEHCGIHHERHAAIKAELEYSPVLASCNSPARCIFVPCKSLFAIPIEAIPSLEPIAISRLDSVFTLRSLLSKANRQTAKLGISGVLNPGNDLAGTQATFETIFGTKLSRPIVGKAPTEEEYFGHGGGECYARTSKIRAANLACEAYLIGCSSGRPLNGDSFFDTASTALAYLHSGCPLVVATLWDVTDKDVDRIMLAALDKYVGQQDLPLVRFIHSSREACLLKHATGRSIVTFGLLPSDHSPDG